MWSYLWLWVHGRDNPHIVTRISQMDTLFCPLELSESFVGFTLLTKLASSTLPVPLAPASRSGLYVMDRKVCQVVLGRTVVVKEAPGFLALIRRSTSQTCGPDEAMGRQAMHSRHPSSLLFLLEAISSLLLPMRAKHERT